jgi:hypothetical protein
MSTYETAPNDTRVKVGHLVTGLVFLGIAGSWALRQAGVIGDVTLGWLFPVILVGAGVIGLLAMVAGTVRRNRPGPTPRHDTTEESNETTDDTAVSHEEENR